MSRDYEKITISDSQRSIEILHKCIKNDFYNIENLINWFGTDYLIMPNDRTNTGKMTKITGAEEVLYYTQNMSIQERRKNIKRAFCYQVSTHFENWISHKLGAEKVIDKHNNTDLIYKNQKIDVKVLVQEQAVIFPNQKPYKEMKKQELKNLCDILSYHKADNYFVVIFENTRDIIDWNRWKNNFNEAIEKIKNLDVSKFQCVKITLT